MTCAIIIPARYESTRFPGKPLAKICGIPMIEHVVEAARRSKLANKIIVATDNKKIFDFVKEKLNTEVCITLPEHTCGTDRIAEVVRKYPDIEYVVNLQGDEPLIPSEYIDKVIALIKEQSALSIGSLITPIVKVDDLQNPNVVKVVKDKNNFALYFSRSSIPYDRTMNDELRTTNYFKHIGIYAFTREAILKFCQLPQSNLEKLEQLEQLRALENGFKIKLDVVSEAYPAVDREEDISKVEEILKTRKDVVSV